MRIAAFNVENLFDRAKIFNEDAKTVSNPISKKVTELSNLLELSTYSSSTKTEIVNLLSELGLKKSDEGEFVLLRQNRGKLVSRSRNGTVNIVANGRHDWIGWVEYKTEPVNHIAILNTGRVLAEVKADIVAVIEADNRLSLEKFSRYTIEKAGGLAYDQIMVIDGNDTRGIDVGIMTHSGYHIDLIRSHIYDEAAEKKIFSRDCPEYYVTTPSGETVIIIPNHFKSKYGGNNSSSKLRRKGQAIRTKEIYQSLRSNGFENIIILGDLNDTPNSDELSPLLAETDLQEVSNHPLFDPGEFNGIGTYSGGSTNQKIDYLLLSPSLFNRVTGCGLFRKGAWPGKRVKKWSVFPELKEEIHAASDHHLIFADIDI